MAPIPGTIAADTESALVTARTEDTARQAVSVVEHFSVRPPAAMRAFEIILGNRPLDGLDRFFADCASGDPFEPAAAERPYDCVICRDVAWYAEDLPALADQIHALMTEDGLCLFGGTAAARREAHRHTEHRPTRTDLERALKSFWIHHYDELIAQHPAAFRREGGLAARWYGRIPGWLYRMLQWQRGELVWVLTKKH